MITRSKLIYLLPESSPRDRIKEILKGELCTTRRLDEKIEIVVSNPFERDSRISIINTRTMNAYFSLKKAVRKRTAFVETVVTWPYSWS
jgi:hypothetical protein